MKTRPGQHHEPGTYSIERLIDFAGRTEEIADDSSLMGPLAGGFFGAVISDGQPKLFYDLSIPDDPVFGRRLAECRTLEVAPVFSKGDLTGWVAIGSREPHAFDIVDVEHEHVTEFAGLGRNGAKEWREGRVHKSDLRIGIVDYVGGFFVAQPIIDRHADGARLTRRANARD